MCKICNYQLLTTSGVSSPVNPRQQRKDAADREAIVKSLLDTRPIFHQKDQTIRGHVFCSFLALVLRKELDWKFVGAGHCFEWAEIKQGLKALQSVTIEENGRRLTIRSQSKGICGKIFQAVGVAMPPAIRDVGAIPEKSDGSANKIRVPFNSLK